MFSGNGREAKYAPNDGRAYAETDDEHDPMD